MSSFSFCYSDRPGTRASLLPLKIEQDVKLERLSRFQAKQEALGHAWLKQRVGQNTAILLENTSKKNDDTSTEEHWQGRDPYGATVNIALPPQVGKAGLLVPVNIVKAKRHTLLGQQAGAPW